GAGPRRCRSQASSYGHPVRRPAEPPLTVYRRRDDQSDGDGNGADDDREGDVLLLAELAPQVVGRDLVDDDEAHDEDDDADEGVEDRAEEDAGFEPFDACHGGLSLRGEMMPVNRVGGASSIRRALLVP